MGSDISDPPASSCWERRYHATECAASLDPIKAFTTKDTKITKTEEA
jgi:hypothetical protein